MPTERLGAGGAMARVGVVFAFAALALLLAPRARADVAHASGAQLRVALVTYGPGSIYWERFGHDAIAITDTASGDSLAFNYGVFDFKQKDFLLNFARGHMRYSIGALPTDADLAWFAGQGRRVTVQHLNLTPIQRAKLRDFLLWNLRPAHAQYSYDYYLDNCATRVRDAFDRVLRGQLHAQWQAPAAGPSYRWQTNRLLSAQPWLMLLVDLGLGPFADQPLTPWQASFLPMVLSRNAAHATVDDGHGAQRPLVSSQRVLARATLPDPPDQPPNLLWPMLVAGLLLGVLLGISGWRARRRSRRDGFALWAMIFALFAGLAGVGLAALWAFTAHHAAWANQNLLLFNPLALLLLPGLWRLWRTAGASGRFTWLLACALGLMALAALPGKWLGLPWQHNLNWIALALPLWGAVILGLWRRRQCGTGDPGPGTRR